MKTILSLIIIILYNHGYGQQQGSCDMVKDTFVIFRVEIFKPEIPVQQFWATAKEFNPVLIDTKEIGSFVSSFLKDKNYCPDLPGGYREELFKCFKDSAAMKISKLEKQPGNIYELFHSIKKDSFKKEFNLGDGFKVRICIVRRHGIFLIRNIETDELGLSSDEFYIDKMMLQNKFVFIPVNTSAAPLNLK